MNHTFITAFLLLPLLGYLLGAIPFGLIIGSACGIDVRLKGSGNIGATNVGRVLGRKWGYLCFILDVAKGLLPVLFVGRYLKAIYTTAPGQPLPRAAQWAWLIVAAMCIVGHMFSIYLHFHGGKGVATSLGVVLGVWPYFTLTASVALLIWIAIWGMWRYVSLASICAAVAFPIIFLLLMRQLQQWEFNTLWPLFAFSCLLGSLVIIRHRSNIARLLAGTENRPDNKKS